MATYTVTTGNDVTQYTVSTGARGPAGSPGSDAEVTTANVLDAIKGTAADPTRIGAEYMPEPKLTQVAPTSGKGAYVVINPLGLSNNIEFICKNPGAAGNSLTIEYAVSQGASVGVTNVGNAWTITLPENETPGSGISTTTAQELIDYINSLSALPFSARPSGIVTGTLRAVSATPFANGTDGTAGSLGEVRIFTDETRPVAFQCISEEPYLWQNVSSQLIVRVYGSGDTLGTVGNGYDTFFYFVSSPASFSLSLSDSVIGQTFSVFAKSDISAFTTPSTMEITGDPVTSILANTLYTFMCTDPSGAKQQWLRL